MAYKKQINTLRGEFLEVLQQPRLIVDTACISLAILGLVGCFSGSRVGKSLGLSALLAGVTTLWGNVAITRLYASTGANLIQREVDRAESDTVVFQQQNDRLSLDLSQTQTQLETVTAELAQVRQELIDSQQALDFAQVEQESALATRDKAIDRQKALDAKFKRYQQQLVDSLNAVDRQSRALISEAVTEQCDRLIAAIAAKQKNAPTLAKIRQEVASLRSHYLSILKTAIAPKSDLEAWFGAYLEILSQAVEEISALRVKFRNALNVSEIKGYRDQVEVLGSQLSEVIPRSQHEAILSEFKIKQDEVFGSVLAKTEELETELNSDIDQYVSKLLREIETAQTRIAQLQEQNKALNQPRLWNPATRQDLKAGNEIIKFFARKGILLDRCKSDFQQHSARLYFYSDRNPRFVVASELNSHAEALQQAIESLNIPEFKFDGETGLASVMVQFAQIPKPDPSAVLATVGTAEDFLRYVASRPIRYRVIGDPGAGKTPLATVMIARLLSVGAKKGNVPNGSKMASVLISASYPNAQTSQKDQYYPLSPFLVASTPEECAGIIQAIYQDYQTRHSPTYRAYVGEFFQIWVVDEADNTLDLSGSGASSKLREIFNDAGHYNVGWILLGQSVNTTKLRGWTNDDRKKSTEIVIGAPKIRAWCKAYAEEFYGSDRVASVLKNLDQVEEAIYQKNESIADEAKRLRIALVADSISPKLFLLPDFDRAEFDLEAYQETSAQAQDLLESLESSQRPTQNLNIPQNLYSERNSSVPGIPVDSPYRGICPDCGKPSSDRKGKPQNGKQRYFCSNPKCSRQSFTVELENAAF